jgi:hypothetical protein
LFYIANTSLKNIPLYLTTDFSLRIWVMTHHEMRARGI